MFKSFSFKKVAESVQALRLRFDANISETSFKISTFTFNALRIIKRIIKIFYVIGHSRILAMFAYIAKYNKHSKHVFFGAN